MNPLEADLPTDSWLVTPEENGCRLDRVLGQRYAELHSRTYFTRLIEEGYVTVEGKTVKKRMLLSTGQRVDIAFLLRPELSLVPEKMEFEMLYEDAFLLAINKPAGLVVHPGPGNWSGTFVHGLLGYLRDLTLSPENVRPGIVHRLDKQTTGVLLAAKEPLTHQRLTEAFANRQVKKRYLAICIGSPGNGELTTQIDRDPNCRTRMAVVPKGGRTAVTRYRTLVTQGELSLVAIDLITGRTHQARVHMNHLHTPVLGDSVYGRAAINSRYPVAHQMLHAYELRLNHPITQAPLKLLAPLPESMQQLLRSYFPEFDPMSSIDPSTNI